MKPNLKMRSVGCVLVLVLSATGAFGQNIIRNPGFEKLGQDGFPTDWKLYYKDKAKLPKVTNDPGQAHSGNVAIRLDGTNGVLQYLKVQGGRAYVFRGLIRREKPGDDSKSPRLRLIYMDEQGKRLGKVGCRFNGVLAGRKYTAVTHRIPVPYKAATTLSLMMTGPKGAAFWWDQLSLTLRPLPSRPLKMAPMPRRREVHLRASNPARVSLRDYPVTVSVPFAAGRLPEAKHLAVVRGSGRAVPAQFKPLTLWWGRDWSVQTLLVTFLADTSQPGYKLVYGTAAPANPPPGKPIKVRRQADTITLDTGCLRCRLNTRKFRFLEDVAYDANGDGQFSPDERVADAGELVMGGFTAAGAVPTSVTVEESGPIRAIVAVHGKFTDTQGKPFMSYVLRLYFYAGQPTVRADYTFIQDTPHIFADVPFCSLDLTLDMPRGADLLTGIDEQEVPLDIPAGGAAALLQLGPERKERVTGEHRNKLFERLIAERRKWRSQAEDDLWERDVRHKTWDATLTAGGRKKHHGQKARGWLEIRPRGKPWRLVTNMRWFWQLHRKKIELAGNRLRWFVVPAEPKPLHLHIGTAKTHTITYAFLPAAGGKLASAYRKAFARAPLYFPTPEQMCGSKVWGPLGPRRPGKFSYYELIVPTGRRYVPDKATGMLNFGDNPWSNNQFNNMETALDYGLFTQFLRTADRKTYDAFDRAVQHFRDVDTCHADLSEAEPIDYALFMMPGYMPERLARKVAKDRKLFKEMVFTISYGSPRKGAIRRHGLWHYGPPLTPNPPPQYGPYTPGTIYPGHTGLGGHGWMVGTVAHYMLTGDRRSYEVADLSSQILAGVCLSGFNWGRGNWSNIDIAALYRMTGSPAWRQHLEAGVDFFYRERTSGLATYMNRPRHRMSPFYTIMHFMRDTYDLTGDPAVGRKIAACVDAWLKLLRPTTVSSGVGPVWRYIAEYSDSRCHGDFADVAYAYFITGDRRYIDEALPSFRLYMHKGHHSTAWFEIPKFLAACAKLGIDPLEDRGWAGVRGSGYLRDDHDTEHRVLIFQSIRGHAAVTPAKGAVTVTSPRGERRVVRKLTRTGLDLFEITMPPDGQRGVYKIEARLDNRNVHFSMASDSPLAATPPPPSLRSGLAGKALALTGGYVRYMSVHNVPPWQGAVEVVVQPMWKGVSKPRSRWLLDTRNASLGQGIFIKFVEDAQHGRHLVAGWSAKPRQSTALEVPINWQSDRWYRVMFTWQRTTAGKGAMVLYVNGKKVAGRKNAANFPTRAYTRVPVDMWRIGISPTDDPKTSPEVAIDSVQIWDQARTQPGCHPPKVNVHTSFLATFDKGLPATADHARGFTIAR